MSNVLLKQNSSILVEVAENYEKFLQDPKIDKNSEQYKNQLNNFKKQFLYLLAGLNKLIEKEKNVK
ncbi:hypothetical protein J4216_02900 [Candidatus Woesearchaeota archaeon]|nr:hypothetical protein [Candidatus Woesearchaeota archaeon]